jgi:hypothetical protein
MDWKLAHHYSSLGEPCKRGQSKRFDSEEVQENEGATLIKVGEFDCAHYKTTTEDNGEVMPMYY